MDIPQKVDVSVITPYYDEPLWMLKRNVESVMNQYTDYVVEHIVVVDNPGVKLEIVQYLQEMSRKTNLIGFNHATNKGLSAARNTALKESSGEFIMLLDTDDTFASNRITSQIDFMKRENYDHTYGGYKEIHGDSKEPMEKIITPPDFSLDYFYKLQNICYCGSNCFKREIYTKLGGFDEKMKEGAEDFEYWIRIATSGYRTGRMGGVLYYLGVHGDNMTAKLVSNGGFGRAFDYIKQKYKHLKFT